MSNYVSPDTRDRSGNPAIQPPAKGPASGFRLPPAAPQSRGVPSRDATLALLVKDKRFARYRDSLGTIKQLAQRWSVDAAELLLVLAATGRKATAGSLNELGPVLRTRPNYETWQDWSRGTGIALGFLPGQVLADKLKKAGYAPYVPSYGQTPKQTAGKGVEVATERTKLTDPYVTIKDGKLRTTQNPNEALRNFNAPVRQSDYMRAQSHYDDYFTKYLGRRAKPAEVVGLITRGVSDYTITKMLSGAPGFKKGPLYQSAAPAIVGYAKSLLGEGWKVDSDFVRQAIVSNWSEGTLRQRLRQRPEYLKGPEFRQNVAAITNVHQTIFGQPNDKQLVAIKEAALGGWSTDQYAAYLRSSPDYKFSSEYQAKALNFLDALGLISGQQPTSQDVAMLGEPNNPNIAGPLPNSPRIKGNEPKPQQAIGPGLAAGIRKVGQAAGKAT